MASSRNFRSSFSPSAPPIPDSNEPRVAHPYYPSASPSPSQQHHDSSPPSSYSYSSSYAQSHPPPPQSAGYGSSPAYGPGYYQQLSSAFPPGTQPEVIRSFRMVDRDHSGFIEETELQEALSSSYRRFGLRTIRLLIFLFKNPSDSSLRIGPKEFTALWSCLGQWQGIFERFDRDRSGKIDSFELRDALYSLGYSIPPSVLQILISRYDDGSGRKVELTFDSFVEGGMIVKGLTEKFKEKDPRYTGSAKLGYDEFMSMIIPFLVS